MAVIGGIGTDFLDTLDAFLLRFSASTPLSPLMIISPLLSMSADILMLLRGYYTDWTLLFFGPS